MLALIGCEASTLPLRTPDTDSASQWAIGEEAPDFTLTDLEGEQVALSDLRGQIVVLHFGTSWCPFCYAEGPHLEALSRAYETRGVRTLVIDVAESEQKARAYQVGAGMTLPVLLDTDGAVAARYAPKGVLPALERHSVAIASNLVIGREGKIQFFTLLDSAGFDAELRALRQRIDSLLALEAHR